MYKKLVRDKIIEKIKANGEVPEYRILDEDEYKQELLKKLMEEINELVEALNRKCCSDILYESADVLEVIKSLNLLYGNTFEDILTSRINKCEKNGSFNNKIFLEDVK